MLASFTTAALAPAQAVRSALRDAAQAQFGMAEVHHLPPSSPGQAQRFRDLAVQAVTAHRPGVALRDHQLAITQEGAIGGESELVVALESTRIGDIFPH